MNRRYRKTIIAGNWKMNKTPAEAKALIEELKPLVSKTQVVRRWFFAYRLPISRLL